MDEPAPQVPVSYLRLGDEIFRFEESDDNFHERVALCARGFRWCDAHGKWIDNPVVLPVEVTPLKEAGPIRRLEAEYIPGITPCPLLCAKTVTEKSLLGYRDDFRLLAPLEPKVFWAHWYRSNTTVTEGSADVRLPGQGGIWRIAGSFEDDTFARSWVRLSERVTKQIAPQFKGWQVAPYDDPGNASPPLAAWLSTLACHRFGKEWGDYRASIILDQLSQLSADVCEIFSGDAPSIFPTEAGKRSEVGPSAQEAAMERLRAGGKVSIDTIALAMDRTAAAVKKKVTRAGLTCDSSGQYKSAQVVEIYAKMIGKKTDVRTETGRKRDTRFPKSS